MSDAECNLEKDNISSVKHCGLSPEEKRAWLFYRNKAWAICRGNVEREKELRTRIAELESQIKEINGV